MTQQQFPVGRILAAPALTAEFEASSQSRYVKYRVQRREHCDACVRMIHASRGSWAPRPGRWRRTVVGGDGFVLCDQHRAEWLRLDNRARALDGLPPLAGV